MPRPKQPETRTLTREEWLAECAPLIGRLAQLQEDAYRAASVLQDFYRYTDIEDDKRRSETFSNALSKQNQLSGEAMVEAGALVRLFEFFGIEVPT